MTGCPFTTETPIGRTFRQQMKGGRKKQVSACRAKKRSYFYGFSHCTTSLLGISRLLLIFLPLLRWIQRNSRQQQQIEPQSFLNSTYRRCTIRTMHLSDEPYSSPCAYMRARNIIMCVPFSSCSVVFKKSLFCVVVNQYVTNKFQKSVRKIR